MYLVSSQTIRKRMLNINIYQYLVFQIKKISEMNHEWKRKIPLNYLVVTHNSKGCMKHSEKQDLWKYDVFPCSNGYPDIIVSETIRFNELQLLIKIKVHRLDYKK